MEIVETPVFTGIIRRVLPDDEYRRLQWTLVVDPEEGEVIPGAKGLRKLRWRIPGKGKSGGLRIIYYLMAQKRGFILYTHIKSQTRGILRRNNYRRLSIM